MNDGILFLQISPQMFQEKNIVETFQFAKIPLYYSILFNKNFRKCP